MPLNIAIYVCHFTFIKTYFSFLMWDFMATYDSFGHGCFWRTLKNQCRAWEGAALSPGACVQDTELGQIVYNPSWSLRSAVKFILEKSKAINILFIEMRFAQLKTCCRFSVLAAATDLSVHCLITFQFVTCSKDRGLVYIIPAFYNEIQSWQREVKSGVPSPTHLHAALSTTTLQ